MSERDKKMAAAAAMQRWHEMSEEERRTLTEQISRGMRSYWEGIPREARLERAKRAAATRKANRLKGKTK